jgi:hypothetical protein
MKNAVFWDVPQRCSYKSRHFGGKYRLHYQGELGTALTVTSSRNTLRSNTECYYLADSSGPYNRGDKL